MAIETTQIYQFVKIEGGNFVEENDLDALADKAADLIVGAKRVVVFTGAGVSTESGIPDFRSPGGIWERFDPDDFTYQKFVRNPESRRKQWQMLREGGLTTEAKPNHAHYAIAELDSLGKLDCVITQNVDNLHPKSGIRPELLAELHGNIALLRCRHCEDTLPRSAGVDRCACGGRLASSIVNFGDQLPTQAQRSTPADLGRVSSQRRHRSKAMFPCSSARSSGRIPDLRCRLSTFWEIRKSSFPIS